MQTERMAIPDGVIEVLRLDGGHGTPLVVLGGVETGLRPLAGTEQVMARRWGPRTAARAVTIVGRPLPNDPTDAERLMHPRLMADAAAGILREIGLGPVAIEAESGGGRIALWLAVDHPDLVARLVLASVAAETAPDSPMAERLGRWIAVAEAGDWGTFFSTMARSMQPGRAQQTGTFAAAARLQPKPATPERFIGELRATLDRSSFVTDRLREIAVPALVIAGELDQVVPIAATRAVADGIADSRFLSDPTCGHTVRVSFPDYDALVEAFLADGD